MYPPRNPSLGSEKGPIADHSHRVKIELVQELSLVVRPQSREKGQTKELATLTTWLRSERVASKPVARSIGHTYTLKFYNIIS